jgi:hypothetical protein
MEFLCHICTDLYRFALCFPSTYDTLFTNLVQKKHKKSGSYPQEHPHYKETAPDKSLKLQDMYPEPVRDAN